MKAWDCNQAKENIKIFTTLGFPAAAVIIDNLEELAKTFGKSETGDYSIPVMAMVQGMMKEDVQQVGYGESNHKKDAPEQYPYLTKEQCNTFVKLVQRYRLAVREMVGSEQYTDIYAGYIDDKIAAKIFNADGLLLNKDGGVAERDIFRYYNEIDFVDIPGYDEYVTSREYIEPALAQMEASLEDIKTNGLKEGMPANNKDVLEKEIERLKDELRKLG